MSQENRSGGGGAGAGGGGCSMVAIILLYKLFNGEFDQPHHAPDQIPQAPVSNFASAPRPMPGPMVSGPPSAPMAPGMATPAGRHPISVGAYSVSIPTSWTPYSAAEKEQLSKMYRQQAKSIYEHYAGSPDRTHISDVVAYHLPGGGDFISVFMSVPPQADLMGQLQREAPAKAQWGIEQGHIKSASPVTPVTRDGFSGFYLTTTGASGAKDFVGGLTHSSRKADVIQLLLNDCRAPDAAGLFQGLLDSVKLTTSPGN
jgi:hypothetical protein